MNRILLTALLFLFLFLAPPLAYAESPFDDLSVEEVNRTVKIIRNSGKFDAEIRFPVVRAQEPPKQEWLTGGARNHRLAYAAIFDFTKSMMSEVIVDLKKDDIESITELPNIKPPVLIEEYERARAIIRADARWQAAVRKRGIVNLEDVIVDMWAPGLMSKEESAPGKRLLRGLTYLSKGTKNFYSRPIEGFVVTVDLTKGEVTQIWDEESAPIASGFQELSADFNQPLDEPLQPLTIKQPEGSSITIDGQEVQWGKWKFRYAMNPMQGLQLYHVRYDDNGTERSILYKIALADMIVPYGAPGKCWTFRNAFDVGEYGLGKTLHPLERGKDVPDNAILLDTVVPDDLGNEPQVYKGVAIYERDNGILWKHRNSENGETEIRRARQLVITFMTTVGNYDYGINYIFNLDGSIQVDAQLTGQLLARGTSIEENLCTNECLTLVEKNVIAPPHQHFFNFRIDFDIDSPQGNFAVETNVVAEPKGSKNPDVNIFNAKNTVLLSEKSAARDLNLATARKWKVFNPNSRNALGHPRGYGLMPGENALPFLDPSSLIRKRAGFVDHAVWFTAYKDGEQSAAAEYPTTAPAGEGLPHHIIDNESLKGADVVMWYTFGHTHIPRPEEWPVMNSHHMGFTLMPMNFFSRNPAMSLPE